MLSDEKRAFFKFFSIYFGSVALLILASGFFYFEQQKKSLIEKEHFSMIDYTRRLKMKLPNLDKSISYRVVDIEIKEFDMENFTITEGSFEKYLPHTWEGGLILVTKSKEHYYNELIKLKSYIILAQIILLILFATISYSLARRALKPMQDAIVKLDNFSKDLIHDINTPITSILLNIKLLAAKEDIEKSRPLSRIKQSVEEISTLHKNLAILLQEHSLSMSLYSLFEIVQELVKTHQKLYPKLSFYLEYEEFEVYINADAMRQILSNIISNACKYNKESGYIKIYKRENTLCIEDGGLGISSPKDIFKRSYKEHSKGSGIGLDIVERLCRAMQIDIQVKSELEIGTTISLSFLPKKP